MPHLIKSSKWGQKDIYDLLIKTGFNSFFWTVDDAYGFNHSNLISRSLDKFFTLDLINLIWYYIDGTLMHSMKINELRYLWRNPKTMV